MIAPSHVKTTAKDQTVTYGRLAVNYHLYKRPKLSWSDYRRTPIITYPFEVKPHAINLTTFAEILIGVYICAPFRNIQT